MTLLIKSKYSSLGSCASTSMTSITPKINLGPPLPPFIYFGFTASDVDDQFVAPDTDDHLVVDVDDNLSAPYYWLTCKIFGRAYHLHQD